VFAAVTTFALAVLGAWTGTTAWRDARRVQITIRPAPHSKARAHFYEDFRLAIVNASARSVSVTDGDVFMNGARLGSVTRIALNADEASQYLPVTLGPGESAAASLSWEPLEDPINSLDAQDNALRDLKRGMPFVLQLAFEPGDTLRVVVSTGAPPSFPGGRSSAIPQGPFETNTQSPWSGPDVHLRTDRVTALRLTHFRDTWAEPDVATLRVWSHRRQRPDVVVSRPALDWLPLSRLETGAYLFAITVGGRVVATGGFKQPCGAHPSLLNPADSAVHIDFCTSGDAPSAGGP
jgi:hypothetical protein